MVKAENHTASLHESIGHATPVLDITDAEVLAAELERVRRLHNAVRLHDSIGYVTPNDEHEGRVDRTRQARRDGLAAADHARRAHPRAARHPELPSRPSQPDPPLPVV